MPQKNNLKANEQGFASIVIALILIIVLALLTVGFAQLARREQQTALNKQLTKQAYYAAESGVNDAYKDIQDGLITVDGAGGTTQADKTNCMQSVTGLTKTPDVNAKYGVSYTCVLVNLTPLSLAKDIDTDGEWHTTFSTSLAGAPVAPGSITITWNSKDGKPRRGGAGTQFTPLSSWGARAVLQIGITPLNQLDRSFLVNNTYTIYGYPSAPAGSATYSPGNQGAIVPGGCTNGVNGICHVTISGLPAGVSSYLIHVIDYYDDSQIVVTAKTTGSDNLNFDHSQAVIDSTGKARSVLKRIQVHVPINPSYDLSGSLEARNICKLFTTDPIGGTQSKSGDLSGYPAGFDVTTPCSLN